MKTARLFKNGQSQAVRLPKEFRLPGDSVYVQRVGECVLLIPRDNPWESMWSALKEFTPDCLESRSQELTSEREDLD